MLCRPLYAIYAARCILLCLFSACSFYSAACLACLFLFICSLICTYMSIPLTTPSSRIPTHSPRRLRILPCPFTLRHSTSTISVWRYDEVQCSTQSFAGSRAQIHDPIFIQIFLLPKGLLTFVTYTRVFSSLFPFFYFSFWWFGLLYCDLPFFYLLTTAIHSSYSLSLLDPTFYLLFLLRLRFAGIIYLVHLNYFILHCTPPFC